MEERLQKILARAGYGSRRACEDLIREGRVTVNGRIAQLGQKVDPQRDRVVVDGELVLVKPPYTYVIVHKPRGVLSDERSNGSGGVTTVREMVPIAGHLYPVGRLDLRSEGLVLLTDDGELANLLTHPRYKHTKEYRVCVLGRPEEETLDKWRKGVFLDGRRTAPAEVTVLHREPNQTWLRVVLHEGRKRQIRRIAAMLGHPVKRLIRVRIGPIQLGNLKPGEWRPLREGEIAQLLAIKKQLKLGSQHDSKRHRLHRG